MTSFPFSNAPNGRKRRSANMGDRKIAYNFRMVHAGQEICSENRGRSVNSDVTSGLTRPLAADIDNPPLLTID
jgi:hypothetical protein